jgi:ribosome maturation factor RimP
VDAEALVGPVIRSAGLELVDVAMVREGARKVLRITVDHRDGLIVDRLSEVSDEVSRALDGAGFDPGPYALEVSSPGIERSLTRPEHFARSVGARLKVKTKEPLAGARTHAGELLRADAGSVVIATASGELRIPKADIASARTVVDWDAELKRSNA